MKYVYFFPITANDCPKIEKSFETADSLRRRAAHNATDLNEVEHLIKVNKVGHFIEFSTGEIAMQQS